MLFERFSNSQVILMKLVLPEMTEILQWQWLWSVQFWWGLERESSVVIEFLQQRADDSNNEISAF